MAKSATLNPSKLQSSSAAESGVQLSPAPRDFAMLSHRGRVRRVNQDSCAALPEHGAYVVCDGIGGAAAGEVASRLATEAFLDSLRRTPSKPGKASFRPAEATYAENRNHSYTRLKTAVKAANEAVFRYSGRAPRLSGMGTTLVAALRDASDGGTLWLANVGDSRCYRLRGGTLEQLTEDHSLVQEQVRAGTLSSVQAAASPIGNIITRAVGPLIDVEADIASHSIETGDIYLLASDGLTRELEDDAIAGILTRTPAAGVEAPLEAACQNLIEAANAQGGRDNITVLLVAFA